MRSDPERSDYVADWRAAVKPVLVLERKRLTLLRIYPESYHESINRQMLPKLEEKDAGLGTGKV